MKLRELGEGGLLELVREWVGPARGTVRVSIGDDAAVLDPSGNAELVVSTDAFVDGVHFSRRYLKGEEIGHRAMAGALSDLAAMGAEGVAAFVNVHAPPDMDVDFLRDVYRGFDRVARPFGVVVAGGDTVRGELAFGITALGVAGPCTPIGRAGARDGDRIYVSGQLGLAEAGRRSLAGELSDPLPPGLREAAERAHREPMPRFDVARLVASLARRTVDGRTGSESVESVTPTAMIDISDGLGIDLTRLCDASGVGCRLEEPSIPVGGAARHAARQAGESDTALALRGGDDYELLFTIDPSGETLLVDTARNEGLELTCVGTITPREEGCCLVREGGAQERLARTGWDHFAESTSHTP